MASEPSPRHVLVCLPVEEGRAASLLAAGAELAAGLSARLSVMHIHPSEGGDPRRCAAHRALAAEHMATSWNLQAVDPVPGLRTFARQHRVDHVLFGPDAWLRWGRRLTGLPCVGLGLADR